MSVGQCVRLGAIAALVFASFGATPTLAFPYHAGERTLGKVRSVIVSGKVYTRLTGQTLKNAVLCKAFMLPPPANYHGEGRLFGRNGRYLKLNDRYGEWPGRYVVMKDFVSVSLTERPQDHEKLVFFRAKDGSLVFGPYEHPARNWAPSERVVESGCPGSGSA